MAEPTTDVTTTSRSWSDELNPPAGGHVRDNRLHIATLWLPACELIFRLVLPVLVTSIFVPLGTVIFFVVCFGLLPTALWNVLHYLKCRYRLTETELVVDSGVVFRRERRIPFDRVQELQLHQGVLHRLLDLARLEITTAGSDTQEASLHVLTRKTAEAIKEEINRHQQTGHDASDSQVCQLEPDFVCQLEPRDLALGGLTSRLVASVGAVVAAIFYFQVFLGFGQAWTRKVEQQVDRHVNGNPLTVSLESFGDRIPDLGPMNFITEFIMDDTLYKSLALVGLGLCGSVLAYVVRYYGFRLSRTKDLLATSYGLLAQHRGTLPRDRIQALKLEESLLRRYLGLASIRVDSAGDRQQIDEGRKRDVLVPVATRRTAEEIVRQAIPGLTTLDPPWQRMSPRAVLRGSKKGWALVVIAMLQTYVVADWICLIWIPALPLVYLLNYQWYRHTGYWLTPRHFLSRKGWLNRELVCLPVSNIQNVSVKQSFFDRRLQLATLSIDTAGQSNTGGGPVIRHLPLHEARDIQHVLARRVAEWEFTW